jgi:hypothetical protein
VAVAAEVGQAEVGQAEAVAEEVGQAEVEAGLRRRRRLLQEDLLLHRCRQVEGGSLLLLRWGWGSASWAGSS